MNDTAPAPRRALFVVTILAGSFLLFLVQPMVARMALPRLGGAPNVWNSAMLVYQALLLGGYAYAHALSRLTIGRQAAIHLVLLLAAALTLPISLPAIAPPVPGTEAFWVPWLFLLTIGPLFFVVSAQAPLMQRWFAASPRAGDPYPLYAASNLGSFAGLLAYPLLAEPLLPLRVQSGVWAAGYGGLIALVALTALARRGSAALPASQAAADAPAGKAPSAPRMALWLALSAVPSGLMLSTTTHLTTDIFAMPLLWVIPLGLYLLSFSIAFAARRRLAWLMTAVAPVVLCAGGTVAMLAIERPGLMAVFASLVLLFVASVALHSRLYETRPEPARLTQFYLVMSAGGALGGVFTALLAPLLFDWTWEHPLLIVAAAVLLPLSPLAGGLRRLLPDERMRRLAVPLLLFLVFVGAVVLRTEVRYQPWGAYALMLLTVMVGAATLLTAKRWAYIAACAGLLAAAGGLAQFQLTMQGARSRSYFGIYTVKDTPGGNRQLLHGTTLHGEQRGQEGAELAPTTYYGLRAGVGQALRAAERLFGPDARIGVVGLGVGTLACYRRPGQTWSFFEIDPEVLEYSRRHVFTFLGRCAPRAPIVIGDARLKLAEVPPGSLDILVVDAFSSDAIPLHLLTREAYEIYFRALAPDGLLLVHISNRFVDLEPVLAAQARARGVAAAIRHDRTTAESLTSSDWVVFARDPARLADLTGASKVSWQPLRRPTETVWSDDYASILPHLRWRKFF
jgi:SAM-dependent methyltransferase